jgi:hypothetical protein
MKPIDHNSLHRTAKYFMDTGQAASAEDALGLLESFGLTIATSAESAATEEGQIALLTLVNLARRTFLAGVEIIGVAEKPLLVPLANASTLAGAVAELGGSLVTEARRDWPTAIIGEPSCSKSSSWGWRLVWGGWRGGVVPLGVNVATATAPAIPLAPAMAAAACAAELFAYHAKDHPLAGRRPLGLSLWRPGADWLIADKSEPDLAYLPSQLWLIGLGNLGQAYGWLLACLPFSDPSQVELLLQDFDSMATSNESTSLLAARDALGTRKTRWVSSWFEQRGFRTTLEERRFGPWTQRQAWEPGVALCGVDNGPARAALEGAGFDLVLESGLGAGPNGFRNFSMHSFPGPRRADQIWSADDRSNAPDVAHLPAYAKLSRDGLDECGLALIASRSVGVPFVGLVAAGLVISELLRRLHGGTAHVVISGSVTALADIEAVGAQATPQNIAYVAAGPRPDRHAA